MSSSHQLHDAMTTSSPLGDDTSKVDNDFEGITLSDAG